MQPPLRSVQLFPLNHMSVRDFLRTVDKHRYAPLDPVGGEAVRLAA